MLTILERAAYLRTAGHKWKDIGEALGVNHNSLRRMASEANSKTGGVTAARGDAGVSVSPRSQFESGPVKPERWVIVGDAQVPFHWPPAIQLAADITRMVKPDHLVYNGDMIDHWRISGHAKSGSELSRKDSAQDDIDRTIIVQDRIAEGAPKARRHQIEGNHEFMLDRHIGSRSPELSSLRALTSEELFSYSRRGFSSYHPYRDGIWICQNLFVYHGECVLSTPGQSVQREIQRTGESTIVNHNHRRAHIRFRMGRRDLCGIENGCLCQFTPTYAGQVNWAHALTVVTKHDENTFTAEVVDIVSDHHRNVAFATYRGERAEVPLDLDDGLAISWRAVQEWAA